jgi:hypothetical protein
MLSLYFIMVLLTSLHGVHTNSKSKSRYEWRSVSPYVKVSSPLWDLWPNTSITFCLKVAVLSLWGTFSDESSGLPFVILSL